MAVGVKALWLPPLLLPELQTQASSLVRSPKASAALFVLQGPEARSVEPAHPVHTRMSLCTHSCATQMLLSGLLALLGLEF